MQSLSEEGKQPELIHEDEQTSLDGASLLELTDPDEYNLSEAMTNEPLLVNLSGKAREHSSDPDPHVVIQSGENGKEIYAGLDRSPQEGSKIRAGIGSMAPKLVAFPLRDRRGFNSTEIPPSSDSSRGLPSVDLQDVPKGQAARDYAFSQLIQILFGKIMNHGKRMDFEYQRRYQSAVEKLSRVIGLRPTTCIKIMNNERMLRNEAMLERLCELGAQYNLSMDWGIKLLTLAEHQSAEATCERIWEYRLPSIPNNLPPSLGTDFIGREAHLKQLLSRIDPRNGNRLIILGGQGGIGKTALLVEAAHLCLKASKGSYRVPLRLETMGTECEAGESEVPTFDAIIYMSAQDQRLDETGIVDLPYSSKTLRQLFSAVANVLKLPGLRMLLPRNQAERVRDALSDKRTLLIVDNWETILLESEQSKIYRFLDSLPGNVRIVITTRQDIRMTSMHLPPLDKSEAHKFMRQELEQQNIKLLERGERRLLILGEKAEELIYTKVGGVPAALRYLLGQVAEGCSLTEVLRDIGQPDGDIARYCFRDALERLRRKNAKAYRLLLAATLFDYNPTKGALSAVAGVKLHESDVELDLLQAASLIEREDDNTEHIPTRNSYEDKSWRYHIGSLTREYARFELANHPDMEQDMRNRWVAYYRNFADENAGHDQDNWTTNFRQVHKEWPNLLEVFEWCTGHGRYDDMVAFWSGHSKSNMLEFSQIYGFWDTRLNWLRHLETAAKNHRPIDADVRATALVEIAWTGILVNSQEALKKAQRILQEAWEMYDQLTLRSRFAVAQNWAVWCIQAAGEHILHYPSWKREQDRLLTEMLSQEDKDNEFLRLKMQCLYWEGIYWFNRGNLSASKMCFDKVILLADEHQWERIRYYSWNYLVEIGIREWTGLSAEEQQYISILLKMGIKSARRNSDLRRLANFKFSSSKYHALLARTVGPYSSEVEMALSDADEAMRGFKRLCMEHDAEQVRREMDKLKPSASVLDLPIHH
jgi:hypothetical protein